MCICLDYSTQKCFSIVFVSRKTHNSPHYHSVTKQYKIMVLALKGHPIKIGVYWLPSPIKWQKCFGSLENSDKLQKVASLDWYNQFINRYNTYYPIFWSMIISGNQLSQILTKMGIKNVKQVIPFIDFL